MRLVVGEVVRVDSYLLCPDLHRIRDFLKFEREVGSLEVVAEDSMGFHTAEGFPVSTALGIEEMDEDRFSSEFAIDERE